MIDEEAPPVEEQSPLYDAHAEMSVLGAVLLSSNALHEVEHRLSVGDFYRPAHDAVYGAMLTIRARGESVDAVTVSAELTRRGELVRIGGAPYLHDLLSGVPTAANVGYYVRIVSELATRRRLRQAGMRAQQIATTMDTPIDEGIEQARAEIDDSSRSIAELHLIGDELGQAISRLDQPDPAHPTPWPDLNHLINGLRGGGLYIIGARPGVGKSLMASDLAREMAKHGGVAFSSLEMSRQEVYERMMAATAGVPYARFVTRSLSSDDYRRLEDPAEHLETLPISIDDRPTITITDIRSHARTMARRGPLAAVIVDYLQLMTTPRGDRRPRHEIVGDFSRSLKILARELDVPVVALSQLNRASASRADQRPTMADLRESGSLEQDANVILLLHVEDEDPTTMHVAVVKNRQGGTGKIRLAREGHYARLGNFAWRPTDALM
jgi:replicative DNA helicase